MASSTAPDDFFGTSFIGSSPYSGPTQDYLGSLTALHSLLQSSMGAPTSQSSSQSSSQSAPQSQPWQPMSYGSWGTPGIGAAASNMQVNNPYNATMQSNPFAPGMNTGFGSNTRYDYSNTQIPQDMWNLRTNLGSYLNSQLQGNSQQPNYSMLPGSNLFNLGAPQGSQEAYNMAQFSPMYQAMTMQPGLNRAYDLSQFGLSGDFSSLMPALSNVLSGQGPQYNLNTVNDYARQAAGVAQDVGNYNLSAINSLAGPAWQQAQQYGAAGVGAANQFANDAWGQAGQYANGAASAYGAAMPTAMDIARTGGAPTQQLLAAVNAIQNQGQLKIQDTLAQLREQYGAQGLGQGSDVNTALALGATRGQADIEAQQSSLLTQILQQAAQTQLGGVNAMMGIGGGLGNLGLGMGNLGSNLGSLVSGANIGAGNMVGNVASGVGGLLNQAASNVGNMQVNALGTAGNLALGGQQLGVQAQQYGLANQLAGINSGLNVLQQPVQNQLASAGVNLNALNAMQGFGSVMNNAFGQGMQTNLGLAGLNQQANQYTNQAQYQNFVRQTQSLPPAVQAALGFGTAFPPAYGQGPSTGAQIGGAAIGAGGGILAALIAAGMLSDRNYKEDITPVRSDVRTHLEGLPISTWRYRGDAVRHIGPMAQDFAKQFGVGDGHMIHLVDVMGVLLQSQKEMSQSLRRLES